MITGYIKTGAYSDLPLFAEGMDGLDVTECSTEIGMNEVDSAKVKLPTRNRAGRAMLQKNAVVELKENGSTVFIGDLAVARQAETGEISLELDGALGWLGNICKPPFQLGADNVNSVPVNFLTAIISQYNAAADSARMIQLGVVTVMGHIVMDHRDEYTNMLDLLREVREQLSGYYFMEYASGIPTLHYIAAPTEASGQVLELGRNVLTVEHQLDFADYASRIYATGHYYVTVQKDGHDERETRLITTCEMDATAEATYGRVDRAYRSDTDMGGDKDAGIPDKTQAEALAIISAEARNLLNLKKSPLRSLEMTAVDLAELDVNYRLFKVGTAARALCAPLNLDESMIVRKVNRYYLNASNSIVTFGRSPRSLIGML